MIPRSSNRALFAAVFVTSLLTTGAPFATADSERADELFKKGRKQLKDGEFAAACESFESSIEAEPSIGAFLNLGECNASQRKLASASKALRKALELAKDAGDRKRARYARKKLKKFKSRLSFLELKIDDGFAAEDEDVEIEVDGASLELDELEKPLALDIGLHRIVAVVDGKERFAIDARLTDEGEVLPILVRRQEKPVEREVSRDAPQIVAIEDGSRVPAFATMAGALAAASVGTYFGLSARSRWLDAEKCQAAGCSPEDVDLARSARFRGHVSTGFFLVAGAAAGASVWLFIRSRRQKVIRSNIEVGVGPRSVTFMSRF